jgi:hypothetical protein
MIDDGGGVSHLEAGPLGSSAILTVAADMGIILLVQKAHLL